MRTLTTENAQASEWVYIYVLIICMLTNQFPGLGKLRAARISSRLYKAMKTLAQGSVYQTGTTLQDQRPEDVNRCQRLRNTRYSYNSHFY